MIKFSPDRNLDDVDRAMLRFLQEDGRMSITDLAQRIGLSPAATHARLRALEAQKYIAGYAAQIDPEKLGYDFTCFIQISFQRTHAECHEFTILIEYRFFTTRHTDFALIVQITHHQFTISVRRRLRPCRSCHWPG